MHRCVKLDLHFITHSVLPAKIIYGAHIRSLHLFESGLVLNQQSGTGSSVPEKYTSPHVWHLVQFKTLKQEKKKKETATYSLGVTQSLI